MGSIVTTLTSCCQWPLPITHRGKGRKPHQSGQLLTKNTQSEIKIRYLRSTLSLGRNVHPLSVHSKQALSLEEGREGKAALPALPNARQRGGPGAAPGVDNTFRLRHVCSLPTPRPASVSFYSARCQSSGNRNTWRHSFIWRLMLPRMNLVLMSRCRFQRNRSIMWLLLLPAQTSAASGPRQQARPCSIHQTTVITSAVQQKNKLREKWQSGPSNKISVF